MKTRTIAMLAVALFLTLPATAQEHDNSAYLANLLEDFNGSSSKLSDLAGAIPDDMYAWRPAEGVRSVSQVFVHVAQANFGLSSALGVAMPTDGPADPEMNVTAKDDVLALLTASQDHVRMAIEMVANEDLSGEIQAFGRDFTRYGVLMILAGHSHEHLGQSIAYARSNGIAPPWSGPQ